LKSANCVPPGGTNHEYQSGEEWTAETNAAAALSPAVACVARFRGPVRLGLARASRCLGVPVGAFRTHRARPQLVAFGGQAGPAREVELPPVELAGEHALLDDGKARQVGLHVRAAPLDLVAGCFPRALDRSALRIEALGVLQPLFGEALEPRVDVVVVGALASGPEAHRQEQLVDPVRQAPPYAPLDQV